MESKKNYTGCAFRKSEKYWMDGMVSEYIHVWDKDDHEVKIIECGYYGSDGRNLYNKNSNIPDIEDITEEIARDMIKTMKKRALNAFCESVKAEKGKVRSGSHVEVIRGRKVKKGTMLNVFWIGERYNQYSRTNEIIAGCREIGSDDNNKPIWIKAEYLKVLNPPKSPNKQNRDLFIKSYVEKYVPENVFKAAKTA